MELKGYDDVIADDDVPGKGVLEEQVHGDTGTLLILQHSCFAPKQSDDSWLRKNFFSFHCTMNGKVCHFIIKSGSCENVVSEDIVRKLSLKVEVHLSPYCLAWLKQGSEIKVSNRALLPLSIGTTSKDDIYCDVVLMLACHILLGWSWQFDQNVVHDGKHNTQFLL